MYAPKVNTALFTYMHKKLKINVQLQRNYFKELDISQKLCYCTIKNAGCRVINNERKFLGQEKLDMKLYKLEDVRKYFVMPENTSKSQVKRSSRQ